MNNQLSHYNSIEPDFFQELEGEIGVKITGKQANFLRTMELVRPNRFMTPAMKPDGEVIYSKIILEKEGARCMALASGGRKIYGMSYPENHFFVYDLETRTTTDIGRIGNINPQCIRDKKS